ERSTNELIFVLVPHIVRAQDVNDANLKGVASGSDQVVKLNYAPRKTPAATAAPAAPPPTATAPAAPPPAAPAPPPTPPPPPPPPSPGGSAACELLPAEC